MQTCDRALQEQEFTKYAVFIWAFYLSKFYEVVDTIILLVKRVKPSFLQVSL